MPQAGGGGGLGVVVSTGVVKLVVASGRGEEEVVSTGQTISTISAREYEMGVCG
jgi:hypothetical protein